MSLLLVQVKNFTIPESLKYALIGFFIVLIVLAALMGVIYLLSYIVRKFDSMKKPAAASAAASESEPALAPGSSGNVKLYNVDDRTAAMVMAIVADEMQTPLNELKFISIKEVSEEDK